MIDREKWGEIYDMARYNGMSPFRYLRAVMAEHQTGRMNASISSTDDEEGIYEACLEFSRSRTAWPTSETPLSRT